MVESKQKEIKVWNMVLLGLSGLSIVAAVLTVASDRFKAGTDDVFLVLVCLMLAGLFAVPPLMWANANGMLKNPFADDAADDVATTHGEAAHGEHGGSNRENIVIWVVLLGLTAIEVALAYVQINVTLMLIILMGASIIKAALIVAYFMHLKFERMSLILTIVPTLVVLLCLFAILFPDSFRARDLRPAVPVQQTDH